MSWSNLALWNAQIALLAAVAAALAAIFRLRPAPARLVYWQVLLAVCLALPAIQPWRQETVVVPAEPVAVADVAVAVPPQPPAQRAPSFPWTDAGLAVLAGGILVRAGWFGLGLARLARYRRTARLLHPLPAPVAEACRRIGVYPKIALSEEVLGPVTFGFHDPVILFPAQFPDLAPEVQSAVATHELLHVRRRDWLFTAIEEMVRAVFWFQPAVWWMLGQIQLAREQSVDRAAVKLSQTRERYVDALLALSGARSQLDLAPAPLFLRRRHLTARVSAILEEAVMSRRRLLGSLAACAGGLLLAGWLVCGRLPLQAAPQFVQDAPGVTVTGANRILHRGAVAYPAEARKKSIEGALVLDVQVAPDGTVSDVSVINGPMELRSSTLKSVLGWHFRPEAVGRQQVIVEFKAPLPGATLPQGGVVGGIVGGVERSPADVSLDIKPATTETVSPLPLERVIIRGVSKTAEDELRGRLALRDGQMMDREALQRVHEVVRDFDAGLTVLEIYAVKRVPAGTPASPTRVIMIQPAPGASVKPEHAPAPGEARDLSSVPRKLRSIDITGIPPERTEELRRRLSIKEGDTLDAAARQRLSEAVKAFDQTLGIVGASSSAKRYSDPNHLPDVIYETLRIGPTSGREGLVPYVTFQKARPSIRRLARIDIQGLAPEAAEELRRRLPLKEGQILQSEDFRRLEEAVKAFDPHLSSSRVSAAAPGRIGADGKPVQPEIADLTIHIGLMESTFPQASATLPPAAPGVQRIRVGSGVQASKLKQRTSPVYPPLAKQARIQGVVQLTALIDAEGNVKNLSAISGHPLLVPSAMEAVRQWQYEITLLNGTPVEVVTQVDVNFSLAQ